MKKTVIVCLIFSLFCSTLVGQKDSVMLLEEVTVSGIRESVVNETSLNISSVSADKMRENGAFNVSDALAKLPGVSQMNTGVGISKPVIRGLYGNRVQAVISGLRFDNQQWQDEHGLGLSDVGIDRIEIIKGPTALLYGSEAVGGILNILEEKPAAANTQQSDLNTRFFTNTYGLYMDYGFKKASSERHNSYRFGINTNADYTDGNNNRVLNSRFGGVYFKAGWGKNRSKWVSQNHFSSSFDSFGFITSDNQNAKQLDARQSRSMDGPHHLVFLNILGSQNTLSLKNATIKLNAGLQSNLRLEDEGGAKISLSMLLTSALYNFQWVKTVDKTTFILGNNSIFENNHNFGSRIIIPDANMFETGFAVFMKNNWDKIILESGIGTSVRNINTALTRGVNTPDREIQPFNKWQNAVNGSVGFAYNPLPILNFKINASSGFRSGNLAELSSNGLHEGSLRWEVGDPNLAIEQNLQVEGSAALNSQHLGFSVNIFNNAFKNYIFLAPTGRDYLGFQVYNYLQYDANLYGGEATLTFKPTAQIQYDAAFSTVTGALANGTYLPFIPANKVHQEIRFSTTPSVLKPNIYWFSASIDNYAAQTKPAQFETPTDAYYLINIGLGGNFITKSHSIKWSVMCNNLLNTAFFDHLSRFKPYNIYNIGRNVALNVHIPLTNKPYINTKLVNPKF
jgi:iron complex outermembrane recepter protein